MINIKTDRGFTLIELLIVIVIIGILAGVLIAVIDPGAQQNRAKDANVKATMNKVALAAEAFNSAYGRVPSGFEMLNSLGTSACVGGVAFGNAACKTGGTAALGCRSSAVVTPADAFCMFNVSGNTLWPAVSGGTQGCSATNYTNNGASACYYRYEAGASTFQIYAKSYGIANTIFGYNSGEGKIEECAINGDAAPTCPAN